MKTCYAFLIACCLYASAFACGWSPDAEDWRYYNVFPQYIISNPIFHPLLRDRLNTFYSPEAEEGKNDPGPKYEGNLSLWKELLPAWSREDLERVLFEDSERTWSGKNSALEQECKAYIGFAKKVNHEFGYRNSYYWDYDKILEQGTRSMTNLLPEAQAGFERSTQLQLKMRYAYQVIRILHYSARWKEAVEFYEKSCEKQGWPENELWYYLTDQVAGCYFSLKDYEKAAYLFTRVFAGSQDRKISAFVSYGWCTRHQAEGKSYFQGKTDQATWHFMRGVRSFSNRSEDLKALQELQPEGDMLELFFMRTLNEQESRQLPKHIGTEEGSLREPDPNASSLLQEIARSQVENPKVTRKDFWRLCLSWASFLNGNFSEARSSLKYCSMLKYSELRSQLEIIYEVFSWTSMNAEKEKVLAEILDEVLENKQSDIWEQKRPNWKHLILDQVAHLYYRNGQLAQAFLSHNQLDQVERIFSLPLIKDLQTFVAKPGKNTFEKQLMRKAEIFGRGVSPSNYLRQVEGHYYLARGENARALKILDYPGAAAAKGPDLFEPVAGSIFSNNIVECFSCPEEQVMEDSVYLAGVFSFIQPVFSRRGLAQNLLQLEDLTRDEKQWKRKVAHYLLGNYYFNVSNTGYHRNILKGYQQNGRNHNYFSYYSTLEVAASIIEEGKGFNLFNVGDKDKKNLGMANRAYDHYQKVMNLSTDRELNARCLYLMAKCELNSYYNSKHAWNYEGGMDYGADEYKESFRILKEEYRDTRFFKRIIRECSFFRYYCSL